jgi:hypothetical protein
MNLLLRGFSGSATLDSASVSTTGTNASENAGTRIYRDSRGQLWIAP